MSTTSSKKDNDPTSNGLEPDDTRIFESDTVKILVGPEKRVFYVHKELLRNKAPYFKACLKEGWSKIKDDVVELKEVDSAGFGFIVTWLYKERLPERVQAMNKGSFDWDMMDKVYKVADRLMITQLQNDLVNIHLDSLAARGSHHWYFGKLSRLYNMELSHTPYYQMATKSLARAIAMGIDTGLTSESIGIVENAPAAVMRELLFCIEAYNKKPWPPVTAQGTDRCEFHIHDGEGRCAKKVKHS